MDDGTLGKFAALIAEIARTRMSFGKFGPGTYPPHGAAIAELPYEYLAWFARKGFPKDRLGELLNVMYLAKRDGADAIFFPNRAPGAPGGGLRRPRRRRWHFDVDTTGQDVPPSPSSAR